MARSLLILAVCALLGGCGAGEAAPREAPTRLFLAGDGELWVVDVGAERVRHVRLPQLPGGDPPERIVRRGHRLVAWGGTTYVTGTELHLRPLARDSWFFLPGARPDRVWIAVLDPDTPATVNAVAAVREMSVDGRVTVPDTRPPGGRWPHAAVEDGLLFPTRRGLMLWDPLRRRVVRRFRTGDPGGAGPAGGRTVISCARDCAALRLTDVRNGRSRLVRAPRGRAFEPYAAAFSPDDRQVAVPVRARGGGSRRRWLTLVDVARAALTVVPRSAVPDGYTFALWSAAGDQVFLTGGSRSTDRVIVAYRPGAAGARRLDIEVGDFYDAAAM